MIWLFLSLSIILNCFLGWFIYRTYQLVYAFQEEIMDMYEESTDFLKELNQVYQLETFYGDPALQSLLKNAKRFYQVLQSKLRTYSFEILEDEEELGVEDGP